MDRQTFTALYDQCAPAIYAYIYYRVRHVETAEDLTSTVFLKALRSAESMTHGKGRLWLYSIARTTVIDHWRTSKQSTSLEDAPDARSNDNPESQIADKHLLAQARQLVEQLPDDQRDVLLMRCWDDLSYDDIADIMGKNRGAVKMMYSRGVKTLRLALTTLLSFIIILWPYAQS